MGLNDIDFLRLVLRNPRVASPASAGEIGLTGHL